MFCKALFHISAATGPQVTHPHVALSSVFWLESCSLKITPICIPHQLDTLSLIHSNTLCSNRSFCWFSLTWQVFKWEKVKRRVQSRNAVKTKVLSLTATRRGRSVMFSSLCDWTCFTPDFIVLAAGNRNYQTCVLSLHLLPLRVRISCKTEMITWFQVISHFPQMSDC